MVPPGPIPNPEVKHQHVDGSRTTGPARVDSRQGSNEAPEPKGSGASSVFRVEQLNTGERLCRPQGALSNFLCGGQGQRVLSARSPLPIRLPPLDGAGGLI